MHIKQWDRPWLRYLAIAIAYAVVYRLLRTVWISHWQLTVGFRLACLLLLPTCYWPAMLLGETAAMGDTFYKCNERGLPWALSLVFGPMGVNMIAVSLFRKYKPVIDINKRVIIGSLLLCILASMLLSTGAEVLEYALMKGLRPEVSWSVKAPYFTYLWFLGCGLGIYMIVPLTMWVYAEGHLYQENIRTRIVRSPLLRDAMIFLLPCLYLLAYTIEYSHLEWVRHIAQVAMVLAPASLAVRYGWQGASLGCVLANLAVASSMPARHDPTTLQTQELMMASSTLWLVFGARISAIRQRDEPGK